VRGQYRRVRSIVRVHEVRSQQWDEMTESVGSNDRRGLYGDVPLGRDRSTMVPVVHLNIVLEC